MFIKVRNSLSSSMCDGLLWFLSKVAIQLMYKKENTICLKAVVVRVIDLEDWSQETE